MIGKVLSRLTEPELLVKIVGYTPKGLLVGERLTGNQEGKLIILAKAWELTYKEVEYSNEI